MGALTASRSTGWLVLAACSSIAGCRSDAGRETSPELGRTLTRVVPGSAESVSAPRYGTAELSVSGSREFVTRRFSKVTQGDAYFVSAENVSATGPPHVRVTVLGVPD